MGAGARLGKAGGGPPLWDGAAAEPCAGRRGFPRRL